MQPRSFIYDAVHLTEKPLCVGVLPQVGADTSPGTNVDVLIPINTMSSTHCELMATKDTVLVKDLGRCVFVYLYVTHAR